MFLKPRNFVFFSILMIRTIIVVSSGRWVNAWLALEVNLMSIIPILINNQSYRSTSSSIKYFITQAIASMFLIFIIIIYYNINIINSLNINNEIIIISLAIKSGIPPFHFWLPQVVENTEIIQTFFILSWQKIAPFIILTYCLSNILFSIIFISAMVGAVGGINQNSIKKILAYSSITHGAWMIFSIIIKQNLWVIYFFIYNIRLLVICLLIEKFNLKKISEINNRKIVRNVKIIFIINILSIAGLPPFLGFFGKIIVIISIIYSLKILFSLRIILRASLISLIYYIKICYSSYLINEKKIFFKKRHINKSTGLLILMVINLIGPIMVYLT